MTGTDTITVLNCLTTNALAGKCFTCNDDGKITKKSYSAGWLFGHDVREVNSLNDVATLMEELAYKPDHFIIRGKALPDAEEKVRRRIHGSGGAFTPQARRWVMLDMDKIPCPAHLNPAIHPDTAIEWLKQALPAPLNATRCWYKFSSSQNVFGADTISAHLFFWCNREVSDVEWKQFFRLYPSNVDTALFSAVQPHYTAKPMFEGMNDPLVKRSGFAKGLYEVAVIPPLPAEPIRKASSKTAIPEIPDTAEKEALASLLAHYPKDGQRDRFCGTVAAVLYRGGWQEDAIAEFILRMASDAGDEEAMKRHNNVHRICEAVEAGTPAMGIPVLQQEFGIDNLDEILKVLGVGKPDVTALLTSVNNASSSQKIKEVLAQLAKCDIAEREMAMDKLKHSTGIAKGTLQKIAKEIYEETQNSSADHAVLLMDTMRERIYLNGRGLMRTDDGNFWRYDGKRWTIEPEDQIKQHLLNLAPQIAYDHEKVSALVNSALNLLEGRVYDGRDPLRLRSEPLQVINCHDGELWFDAKANQTFKPHSPESFIRHCLPVKYDPKATAPKFEQAVKEIFRNNESPKEMFRHFCEFMGYACQPWRGIPLIMMFYGGGSNGKTGLSGIIGKLLGHEAVMSCRIGELEKNRFLIGALSEKLMLIDDDVDAGTCLPDGMLKKISEAKMMTGEYKYGNSFEFTCRSLPLMLANEFPTTKDLSHGLLRRVHIIPFNRQFHTNEIQLGLFDEIWKEEASGILNLAIAGYQRVKRRGKFDEPQDCLDAKRDWQLRSNALLSFIDERCVKEPGKQQKLEDFYRAFQSYMFASGGVRIPNVATIRKRLEGLGYSFANHSNRPVIIGLSSTGVT